MPNSFTESLNIYIEIASLNSAGKPTCFLRDYTLNEIATIKSDAQNHLLHQRIVEVGLHTSC